MQYERINSERAYVVALTRIDQLMGAKANTADGDELDRLASMVQRYERKVFPLKRKKQAKP